MSPATIKRT